MVIDGKGNIFIADGSSDYIFRYTHDGKYVNRFGGKSDENSSSQPGTFDNDIDTMAVDNQSRVYAGTFGDYSVFDADGHYLHPLTFPVSAAVLGFAIDESNNIYFIGADNTGHRIPAAPTSRTAQ